MTAPRVLLSSASAPGVPLEQQRDGVRAALAENVFARLNAQGLIGDGSFARPEPTLLARLRSAVDVVDDVPIVDYRRLLALGVLVPHATETRLRAVLRLADGAVRITAPSTQAPGPRARPKDWATLGPAVPAGSPTRSGWYLRVRQAWPEYPISPLLGSHSSLGYYDADAKRWGMVSSMDYEYEPARFPRPGVGGEVLYDHDEQTYQYYPVDMGPAAAATGLTPEQFRRAVFGDVVALEAHYRALARVDSPDRVVLYSVIPGGTPDRIDGNCNTYISFLLASLGVSGPFPRGGGLVGTAGEEVIRRDRDGDVYIYGSGRAAKGLITTPSQTFGLDLPKVVRILGIGGAFRGL